MFFRKVTIITQNLRREGRELELDVKNKFKYRDLDELLKN